MAFHTPSRNIVLCGHVNTAWLTGLNLFILISDPSKVPLTVYYSNVFDSFGNFYKGVSGNVHVHERPSV